MSLIDDARKAVGQVKASAAAATAAREATQKAYDQDRPGHARAARAKANEAKSGAAPAKKKALQALQEAKRNGWKKDIDAARAVVREALELEKLAGRAQKDAAMAEKIAGISP